MARERLYFQLFYHSFTRLRIAAHSGQLLSYQFILRSNVRVSRQAQQLNFDQDKTMVMPKIQVEVDGVDEALEKLTLGDTIGSVSPQDKSKIGVALSEMQGDTRVLHKHGYDDDLFKIEKHGTNFTHAQIRDFESHLDDKEEEAYAQGIIRQVEQSAATTTKAKAKTTKKRMATKLVKGKKNGTKEAAAPSPSPPEPKEELAFKDNEVLRILYENWNLPHSTTLPIVSPLASHRTPFEFYTKHNPDVSIIKTPRLSVTKLLVNNWCQMRDYYKVHAGSPRLKSTPAMEQGTAHHARLEEETHPLVDITDMLNFVSEKVATLKKQLKSKGKVPNTTQEVSSHAQDIDQSIQVVDELLTSSEEEVLANAWSHKVITRLFALLTNSQAREIPLHGYIDMNKSQIIEPHHGVEALNNSVLVSSIVDLFKFQNHSNPTDLTFITEMKNMMDFEFDKDKAGTKPMIDLTRFIPEAQKILSEYKESDNGLSLVISDVKTRSENTLPHFQSVIKGAKCQTYLYQKFFKVLTMDAEFTYHGLLENATRKKVDIDKPLSPIMVLQMLRLNPNLFYHDFIKLSRGKPIGFKPYDDEITTNKVNKGIAALGIEGFPRDDKAMAPQQHYDEYRFDLLFQNANEFSFTSPSTQSYLDELEKIESKSSNPFPYKHYMEPLLRTWQTPLTLRYLAARSAQLFNLFNNFVAESTTVEYHNALTQQVFEICQYFIQKQDLQLTIDVACDFWLGRVVPQFADSKLKCKSCEFKLKCIVGRGEAGELMNKRKMVGPKLREFVGQPI